jgi:hypothetical protein
MLTFPETLRVLQVPHTPARQELGIDNPSASAASKIVSFLHARATWPELRNTTAPASAVIGDCEAPGAGDGGSTGEVRLVLAGRGRTPRNRNEDGRGYAETPAAGSTGSVRSSVTIPEDFVERAILGPPKLSE